MELTMNMLNPIFARLNKMPRAALITIGLFVALGTFAPWLAPQDPSTQNLLDAGLGPSTAHWLGTDHLGRDTFSRLIIAANTSLVSVGSVLGVAMTIGILLGTIAGYHRGWVDDLLMRVVDVGLSIPSLIISLAVIGIVGPGYWTMVLALALAWWPMSGR
ncbi:ABC transporter permease, partial [Sinorhizobium sp. GL28]|uniref:ABC transporter permease n=1 Tax=Sinorhizobium sp. GL28 TaxID=1358418 RepID=UPI00072417CA